ncbi:alkylmercury lyase [Allosaccharopolyspora coralli]|uniref:Alkylmercury lyase n=1 Tax=Allosaccharopolyspora coralli TaxID=2665642 RepID=A0A5Q3Q5R0_9PSEU|nr:alkylmercury lyase [Allosaccharopolyspora coralli]QGK69961.1 alkylmercury lyase [Allosaccharopolyspora coralli]
MNDTVTIELRYVPDCPLVGQARATLRSALARAETTAHVEERVGDYPSPTLAINGRDALGHPLETHECCRLDLPTEPQILDALQPPQ